MFSIKTKANTPSYKSGRYCLQSLHSFSKMVGKSETSVLKLEDVLTAKHVHNIKKKLLKNGTDWCIVKSEVKQAADGLAGFLADHLRVTLHLESGDSKDTIQLFVKRLPTKNQPKADFISKGNYFKREELGCLILDEIRVPDDPQPWCPYPLIYNDTLIVMTDLCPLGYSVRDRLDTLDLPHVLASASSLARFHAATANYETRKQRVTNTPWTFPKAYPQVCEEPTFKDSPWMRCAAKLTDKFLKIYSKNYKLNLESQLAKLFIEACSSLQEYDDTLNTLLHKDMWMSNIMFRYENGLPVNAIIIDYQLLRYGPPAFDLTVFLYCTTSRAFREQYEKGIFLHYYSEFLRNLEEVTKQRLSVLGYDEEEFQKWCERSRMFGVMMAVTILPYVLMDSKTAENVFDDPDTFEKHLAEDRTEPVVAYCEQNSLYRDRLLEVSEEYVERYVVKNVKP